MKNRFCTNCGTPITEGNRFCGFCGEKLPVNDEPDLEVKSNKEEDNSKEVTEIEPVITPVITSTSAPTPVSAPVVASVPTPAPTPASAPTPAPVPADVPTESVNSNQSDDNVNPSNNKKATILGVLALVFYFLSFVPIAFYNHVDNDTFMIISESVIGIFPIAGIVLMIVGRCKYPKNLFLKVVMWIIIVCSALVFIAVVVFCIACAVSCISCVHALS